MSNDRPVRLATTLFLAATLAAATGCNLLFPANTGDKNPGTTKLAKFDSETGLLDFFKQRARQSLRRNVFSGQFGGLNPTIAEDSAALSGDDASAGDGGEADAFTTTNIQESGVDESDVFKSDGRYFYVARGPSVRIVDVGSMDQMSQVGRIDFDQPVYEMYLRGDHLLVLTQRYRDFVASPEAWLFEIELWPPYYGGTDLVIHDVDVTDRANPVIADTVELEGNLVNSRLTNDRLILVMTIAPDLPTTLLEVQQITLDDVLPKMRAGGAERDLVAWPDWYRPGTPDGYFMTAVVTLDADNLQNTVGSAAVLAGAGTIYSSRESLYLTDTDYDPNDGYRESTVLHKFAFADDGAAEYVATGSVPGRLLNQFSLGEHDGYLRVATHIPADFGVFEGGVAVDVAAPPDTGVSSGGLAAQSLDPPQPSNAVFVLGQNGADLVATGSVRDIAPGERLYSARFMGDRGFLVTFRQIDPLFTLDLADPANPTIRGELKIPGFSDYLHPWGENYLIGVGRSVQLTQWGGAVPSAVQLSLFDVSDLDNPRVVQQIEIGGPGSWTDVSSTHKAFAFLPDRALLAFPVQVATTNVGSGFNMTTFDGVVAYAIDPAQGFQPAGTLRSATGQFGYRNWARAAMIGDRVYAVTDAGINVAQVEAFEASSQLNLAD